MEEKVRERENQFELIMHTSKQLQGTFFPTALCTLAMQTFTESVGGVSAGISINLCSGCSLPHQVHEITAMVKMPCEHNYHLLCFAAMCELRTECIVSGCHERLPTGWCTKLMGQGHLTPMSSKLISLECYIC